MDEAYSQCRRILDGDMDKLNQVADFLIAHENMSGEQFAACMEGKAVDTDSDQSLFAAFVEKPEQTEEE